MREEMTMARQKVANLATVNANRRVIAAYRSYSEAERAV
jgi:hypothetical protein